MYSVKDLKKQYECFKAAKEHFGLKARGWEDLAKKLNAEQDKVQRIKDLEQQVTDLQNQLKNLKTANKASSELDILLLDFVYKRGVGNDEIFESPEALENEPEDSDKDDWASFYSTLNRRYHRLAKRYHPDNGGAEDQMRNLVHSYEASLALVRSNNGMDL